MDVYITEQEQIEKIKDFIKNYAVTILLSIALVFAASYGYRTWQQHQEKLKTQAATGYELMMINYKNHDLTTARLQAERLKQDYPKSPYASLAALMLAQQHVYSNDLPQAVKNLQWIIEHSTESALKQIARNREAQILIGKNDPKAALALLEKDDDKYYLPVVEILRGDAYAALGKKNEAQVAYQNALKALPSSDSNYALVQMKLNDV